MDGLGRMSGGRIPKKAFEGKTKSIAKSLKSGIIKEKGSTLKMDLQFFAESDIKNQESGSLKRAIRKYEKRMKD